jgi:hypothetical protein
MRETHVSASGVVSEGDCRPQPPEEGARGMTSPGRRRLNCDGDLSAVAAYVIGRHPTRRRPLGDLPCRQAEYGAMPGADYRPPCNLAFGSRGAPMRTPVIEGIVAASRVEERGALLVDLHQLSLPWGQPIRPRQRDESGRRRLSPSRARCSIAPSPRPPPALTTAEGPTLARTLSLCKPTAGRPSRLTSCP